MSHVVATTTTATAVVNTEETQRDALRTLMSVNSIDQSVFTDGDSETIGKYWSKVFLQNSVGEDIYNAIANKSGTAAATRDLIAWTKIPYDFLLDKANYTQSQLEERFAYAQGNKIFEKDDGTKSSDGQTGTVALSDNAKSLIEQFADRLRLLREFIIDLALPRLKQLFASGAEVSCGKSYPHCKSLDDYLHEYRNGTYDNEKRALIDKLCNHVFGKSGSGKVETNIMNRLRIQYTNEVFEGCTNGNLVRQPKTRRAYGNVKKMIQRLKQTYFVDRFRTIGLEVHQEVVYHRYMSKPTKGVVKVIKVDIKQFGFDGFLGLGVGHPLLLKIDTAVTVKPKKPDPSPEERSIFQYLQETAPDILACWTKATKQDKPEIVTLASEDFTVASSLTSSDSTPPRTGDSPSLPQNKKTPTTLPPNPTASPIPAVAATLVPKATKPKTKKGKRKAEEDDAPRTPVKKSRVDISVLPPEAKSPERMLNGLYCYGCDHNQPYEPFYIPYERNYFTKDRMSLPNHPTHCANCKKSFGACPTGGNPDDYAVVNGLKRVQACRNAVNHRDHTCVHALCCDCFLKHPGNASPNLKDRRDRSRRGRKQTKG